MWIIKVWAEPPVQHLGYAARAAAHSGIWILWLVLLQCAVAALIVLLRKIHLQPYSSPPKLSAAHMLGESILGYSSWTFMLGAFAAWVNPGAPRGWQWDYSCPNLLLVGYFSLAVLMLYDAYSYVLHKWMHDNKTAFRMMHRKHHEVKAMLNIMTSGYMAAAEGVFSSAVPMCVLYALGVATGNWWYTVAGLWNSFSLVMLGHCGDEITLNDPRDLLVLLLNPMALLYFQTPCHASPMDHADHHTFPSKNYSFFFTFWDDLFGSSRYKQPPCSLLVLSAHALYQLAFLGSTYLWATQFWAALAVCAVCYWIIPPATAAAAAEKLQLPQLTRSALGWLMDAYRTDNCITYATTGEPGALPAPAAAAVHEPSSVDLDAPPRAVSAAKDQRNAEPVYMFACHPVGLLSRAAFCTFAARGWCSPVSGLRQVRLAVGSQAFRLPIAFVREFLLACACIPADRASIRDALQSGCSVALTPGGWREGRLFGSYKLVLKQRRGFVQLAHEAGALLVPVLCLGEQDLAQAPISGLGPILWGYRLLQTFRPQPVKVIFGQVVACEEGESIEKLHSRYAQALMALGREHGVQLELVQ